MNDPNRPTPGRTLAATGSGLSTLAKSKLFIFAAAGMSFLGSVALWFSGAREQALFVGLWVPSILSAGALLIAGEAHTHE
jgi:hypothetical protein